MEMNSSSTVSHHHQSPPPTPVTISDPNNPYPTTFVQADTTSFKQVVQLLTGSSETLVKHANTITSQPSKNPIHLTKTSPTKRPSKLYERRNSLKNFKISPLVSGSTRVISNSNMPEILSPSLLDFPSLVLSPVTPLIPDPFNRSPVTDGSPPGLDVEAEEKAIAGKGFYLHPSPVTTPRSENELQLLPLFPVTSPRCSGGSTSSS
uniref:VQ motif-containing protein 4-like n=1 Tax=Erigeron canadensis TaxID=72917 RepID=UPI001CB96A37|nr:VQ motif-containing protein 4-like [Erigeron canadensis]